MNLPLFVAWRYFFSKNKLKVIHIISLISLIGIAITTMALIIVLSVFNGFTDVGKQMLSSSNPPLILEAKQGKVFSLDSIPFEKLRSLDRIDLATPILKENAIASIGDYQALVDMKGIDNTYLKLNNIDTSISFGEFNLLRYNHKSCIVGLGVAKSLAISQSADKMGLKIKFVVPKRQAKLSINSDEIFNTGYLLYSGAFKMNSEMDYKDVFVPIDFAREILNYDDNEVSAIYIKPKKEKGISKLKKQIQSIVGERYTVKDIFEQDPIYQKVIKSERLGVYIILSFIIFIATFNVMGALSLLIMDKKRDILILRSMGASLLSVRMIYFLNGLMLSFMGALLGLLLGSAICLLQQQFGIIKMGSGDFIRESFPVSLRILDVINVFLLVLSIGAVSVMLMIRRISFENKINQ